MATVTFVATPVTICKIAEVPAKKKVFDDEQKQSSFLYTQKSPLAEIPYMQQQRRTNGKKAINRSKEQSLPSGPADAAYMPDPNFSCHVEHVKIPPPA